MRFPKVAQLKTVDGFRQRLQELQVEMPCDDRVYSASEASPLASSLQVGRWTVGNRWCIHPMEGWDGQPDGVPSDLTRRRWQRFGESGAKLIWGGEAAAVQHDGRANPRQIMATPQHEAGLRELRRLLVESHIAKLGNADGLVVGLQLTHSGRFSRPNSKKLEPRIAYHHPLLDRKFSIDPHDESVVWTDSQLEELSRAYVEGAKTAERAGFEFVDVKACHGYLLHEFLSARSRPGKFGGDLEGRSRLLRMTIERIREECPKLEVGVRLSLFDRPPYEMGDEHGVPMDYSQCLPYTVGFGLDPQDPLKICLDEPVALLKLLQASGVCMVNLSCGSPYYNPHIQRPAAFPPSDGYLPPEDPLVGVARQMSAVAQIKKRFPQMPLVGSGYTYLQDFLPHVGQAAVREGWVDFIGLGRMVLSYPTLPWDTLHGQVIERKKVCRTFSDCTTAPRNAIISGCYPLDDYYKAMPEAEQLKQIKKEMSSEH
ncbi:MAG: NADH:flavin oxidoreductase [Pirellulales bacterium]